jgi:DNA-directed RNA polymerase specialized sigma24 family protein
MIELSDSRSREEFRLFAASNPVLSAFPTASQLIRKLRGHENHDQNSYSDEILLDLLSSVNGTLFSQISQRIMLLVFIPAIHRTTSQIAFAFPSLTRDDTAQHLFAVVIEFLRSKELRSRHSHIGFTIARKIRRSAFRWAIRESHRSLRNETDTTPARILETDASAEDSHAVMLLQQFLDYCQGRGWLSSEERQLLVQFKVEGISCRELARPGGHSAVAIRHRIQRVLDRLRRIAQAPGNGTTGQLNFFLRE